MARHILTKARNCWEQYSLPILLVLSSILLLGHRVEPANDTNTSSISGYYGPGAVLAWLISAFSMFCTGSGQILFSKWHRYHNPPRSNVDPNDYEQELVELLNIQPVSLPNLDHLSKLDQLLGPDQIRKIKQLSSSEQFTALRVLEREIWTLVECSGSTHPERGSDEEDSAGALREANGYSQRIKNYLHKGQSLDEIVKRLHKTIGNYQKERQTHYERVSRHNEELRIRKEEIITYTDAMKVAESLWPPERKTLRVWNSEGVIVIFYAIIAYIHTCASLERASPSKADRTANPFLCSPQAAVAHNILQLSTWLSHMVLIIGHMQDHQPAGYDPRPHISTFFGTWSALMLAGTILVAIISASFPIWLHLCHCLAFVLPLLLESTRQRGVRIVFGGSIIPVILSMAIVIPFALRSSLGKKQNNHCDKIHIVIGFPFPKSGAAWTDLDQMAAIAGAVGSLLYKAMKSKVFGKLKESWRKWRDKHHEESHPLLSVENTSGPMDGPTSSTAVDESIPVTGTDTVVGYSLRRNVSFPV